MANARRTLEAAADFARGGRPPAPDHDANHQSRQSRVEAEQTRLIQWARENRKLSAAGYRLPVFARGGEHEVYFSQSTRRYIKATRLDRHKGYGIALGSHSHGATPSEYLDRLSLHNWLFDDDVRLERVALAFGQPVIISSQPALRGGSPSQFALDRLMLSKGYEILAEGAYYGASAGLLVFDLFPRNAIQAADGHIYPFDPVIQRIDQEFAQFLRQEPHVINLAR